MELEKKKMQLEMLLGLAEEKSTLRSKLERMCTSRTSLQSESGAIFMVMDKTRALCNKRKSVVREVPTLNKRSLS